MRTTLSLDDDVVARLDQLRAARRVPLKQLVNDALRAGLDTLDRPPPRRRFRTRPLETGRLLIDVTSAPEALAIAEGDDHR